MRKVAKSEFDVYLEQILEKSPGVAKEYAKQFAELPLPTQLAIMRRRRSLSQKTVARKLKLKQPHIARVESVGHDPRLSSVLGQARALHCHLMVVPNELLSKVAQIVAAGQRA